MLIFCPEKDEIPYFLPQVPQEIQVDAPGRMLYGAMEEQSGAAVGVLLVEADGNALDLLWLCTADGRRRQGIGRALVMAVLEDAAHAPALSGVYAQLLAQDTSAAGLLQKCGFALRESGAAGYSFPLGRLEGEPFWKKAQNSRAVVRLEEAPAEALRRLNARFAREDSLAVPWPVRAEDYDTELSFCCLVKGQIAGILLSGYAEGVIQLSYLYAEPQTPIAAGMLLQAAAHRAAQLYPSETEVRIAAVSPAADKLVRRLVPGAQPCFGWEAAYVLRAY